MTEIENRSDNAARMRQKAEEKALASNSPDNLGDMSPEDIQQLLHELRIHQIELEMQNEEMHRIQEELEISKERYFDLYNLAPVGYFTLNEQGLFMEANLTAASILGVDRARLLKQPMSHFILKEDQDIYYFHRKLLFETGEPQECDLRMLRYESPAANRPSSAMEIEDGFDNGADNNTTVFWVHVIAAPSKSADGKPVCRAVINDISARKKLEETSRRNLARLERAQAIAHVGDWELYIAEEMMWASAEAFRIYGLEYTSQKIPLALVQQLPIEEDRLRLDTLLSNLIHAQVDYDITFQIRRQCDGAYRTVHSSAVLQLDANGNPYKVVGIIHDITESHQITQKMLESEQRYRSIFENLHTSMLLINPENGAILDANPAAAEFYGWTFEELTNMNIAQINTLSTAAIQAELELAISQQRKAIYFQHRIKSGEIRDVQVFRGLFEINGKALAFSIIHDITERKRSEDKINAQLNELKRWQTASLGREMRNLELKAEINELLSQAGLPPRYSSAEPGENQ